MRDLPTHLKAYKKTDTFNEESVPKGLLNNHSTKKDVWGKICVIEGELLYTIEDKNEEHKLTPSLFGVVEPEVKHRVKPLGKVRFYVEFYK